ncbi:cycloeucalenol cycloisomerase isoform X3 [Arachis ipaensis]|uniref:cycloeucalenol cycloisomerase isoform X3 n=1 Tax=Arachis ipaensis TaxID=130454 RepID=UPI000A2B0481|nr:cycloeucalenol cycloisomerase isoform X3 [Arachis ipaensis]XP_025681906.1 cycloeucalenol cycloisomerase isoform X3 [Arachis hypogaea]
MEKIHHHLLVLRVCGCHRTEANDGENTSFSCTHRSGSHSVSALLFPSNSTSLCDIEEENHGTWQNFAELEYLLLGLVSAVPSFLIPMLLVGKASLWIVLFSYVGNYFWTHYFFTVLGASYTFPSWRMNNVPHTTFLLTHVCFLFYHVASNMTLRRLRHFTADLPETIRWATEAAWILALSYFIAYLETLAISNFPYYSFVDRDSMYKVGSLFYAIYFIVSFPMFLRIDEKPGDKWDLARVAVDALGAAMLVTIILDLWRIFLGPIVPISDAKQCPQSGLPWFSRHANLT